MNRSRIAILSLTVAGVQATSASAAVIEDASTAMIVVNGKPFDLSDEFAIDPLTQHSSLSTDLLLPTGKISVDITIGDSELLTFGIVTSNQVAGPVTYSFTFGTPVTPRNYTAATSTAGVTVTPGIAGSSTVANSAVYPTFVSGSGTVGATPTNLGVDLGTGPLTASGGLGGPSLAQSLGLASNTFAPVFYDGLRAFVTYTQTDVSSSVAFTGAVTLSIPEPTSLAAGLLLLLGRRRRDA